MSKAVPWSTEQRSIGRPTEFIAESITEVYKTIGEAAVLVAIVVLIFLQSWRTAIIPIVAMAIGRSGRMPFSWATS